MEIDFSHFNWFAILTCVVIGQVFLTVWFFVLFGERWAKAYGAVNKQQHTKEIPPYVYVLGLLCMILLTMGLAILQKLLAVNTLSSGLMFGFFVALHFCIATSLPGYAFLKRWSAFFLAIGSQVILILILSVILALWQY